MKQTNESNMPHGEQIRRCSIFYPLPTSTRLGVDDISICHDIVGQDMCLLVDCSPRFTLLLRDMNKIVESVEETPSPAASEGNLSKHCLTSPQTKGIFPLRY
ncbi:uncharacterized protein LOC121387404 [Gigantopelta aegis]|uniref:uncharacterized protein LOC121387404 n=1 Tax=Gigantopelta aegis TaxID=1735272 RepID=UPI001B88BD0A|nr:uncharacterized protein LOC121387404 [Gigantopelta aegis]